MDSARSSSWYYKRGLLVDARLARKRERPMVRINERSYNNQLRDAVLEQYGKQCASCGFDTDVRILQLDHINGGGNTERRQIGVRGIRKNALQHPEQYQLLCPNCNWTKRYDNNEHNVQLSN